MFHETQHKGTGENSQVTLYIGTRKQLCILTLASYLILDL